MFCFLKDNQIVFINWVVFDIHIVKEMLAAPETIYFY